MAAPAEPDDDLDEVLDLEPRSGPSIRRRGHTDRPSGSTRGEPVRRWRSSDEPDEPWDDDVVDERRSKARRERRPIFWRARDSLYFEPLVALAIIVVLLVSLFAYTSNWPPVYVVESNSMQHGSGDHLGVLNAGDIVLAQKVSFGSIVTYVRALSTGLVTYGSFGDVLLYYPNGSTSATPIIHRAILYFQYDASAQAYNASGLAGLACGPVPPHFYYTPGTAGGCGTTDLTGNLTLYDIGGRTVFINLLSPSLGSHSGFLTLGDNNTYPDQLGPAPLSSLVEPGWVVGVARGLIPWFGALKLLLDGNAGKVPSASWEYLGLTIAGVIFAAAGVHLLLRREREARSERRPRDDEELEEEERPTSRPSRPQGGMRAWKSAPEPLDDLDDGPARPTRTASHEQRRRAHFTSKRDRSPSRRRRAGSDTSDEGGRSGAEP